MWDKLAEVQKGETIELEGYLSQTEDGRWLLSPISNCCRRSEQKQVTLLNDNFSHYKSNTFLKVGGIIRESYTLGDIKIIEKEQHAFPILTGIILLLGVAIFWLIRRFKWS